MLNKVANFPCGAAPSTHAVIVSLKRCLADFLSYPSLLVSCLQNSQIILLLFLGERYQLYSNISTSSYRHGFPKSVAPLRNQQSGKDN